MTFYGLIFLRGFELTLIIHRNIWIFFFVLIGLGGVFFLEQRFFRYFSWTIIRAGKKEITRRKLIGIKIPAKNPKLATGIILLNPVAKNAAVVVVDVANIALAAFFVGKDHSFVEVCFYFLNLASLFPGIHENENVVGCYP